MTKKHLHTITGGKGKKELTKATGPIYLRHESIECTHCGNIGDRGSFGGEIYTKVNLKISSLKDGDGKPIPGRYDVDHISYDLTDDIQERVTRCLVCGAEEDKLKFTPLEVDVSESTDRDEGTNQDQE